ncbi:hypothetical protein OG896_03550 [Streptomyces sp. NBC_00669]|uniref:hypothetical protein n=1 Tax=Streptomyces sp. NBC_00669 TaxID=2976011 RepID=UPI002E3178AA|nr:hypothetical protein [Streptomyces sp. NBC_00669]
MRQLRRDTSEPRVRRVGQALSAAGRRAGVERGWFRADASAASHRRGHDRRVDAAGTFPLADWREALDISLTGHARGKLLPLPAESGDE